MNAGIFENKGHILRTKGAVQRNGDCTNTQNSIIAHSPLRPVFHQQAHPLTRFNADSYKAGGDMANAAGQLFIAYRNVAFCFPVPLSWRSQHAVCSRKKELRQTWRTSNGLTMNCHRSLFPDNKYRIIILLSGHLLCMHKRYEPF